MTLLQDLTDSDMYLDPGVGSGQGQRLHPYTVSRIFDDPDIVEHARREHGKLRELWTSSKLAAMSTEQIERRLRDLGIRLSRERFLTQARNHTSAWELSRAWLGRVPSLLSSSNDDFLGVAACELWKRYCPDHPSVEMLNDWMQEGYHHFVELRPLRACDKWLELWQVLLERLTPEMRSTDDAEKLINGTQCIFNWIQDFTDTLHNAALDDLSYAEKGIEFFRQALAAFPDEHGGIRRMFVTEMASMHFRLGRDEEGERILLDLIAQEPDKAAGYTCLADELSSYWSAKDPPRDLDRAIRLLEDALERPVDDADDWDVEGRLEYLRDRKKASTSEV